MQFAEFLQHSSLIHLGILYPSTSVGLRYGLYVGLFLEFFIILAKSNNHKYFKKTVTTNRLRNINLISIDYPFGVYLRSRLTL